MRVIAIEEHWTTDGIDEAVPAAAPPGTNGLPAREAAALSRDANDHASAAVERHPTRLRAMTTLPMADADAALAELERTATAGGHVGVMSYGRSGERPLDDPVYDELLAAAASLRRPVFIHPQIPPDAVYDASYRGFDPTLELALATFGWGWHIDAGLAALRSSCAAPSTVTRTCRSSSATGARCCCSRSQKSAHANAETLYTLAT